MRIPAFYKIACSFLIWLLIIFQFFNTRADDEQERESLKGLPGVYVLIEALDSEAIELGLNKSTLQVDIELKLRKAGIKVYTREESFEIPGMPYVYLNINSLKHKNAVITSYAIDLELKQIAILKRNQDIELPGTVTWSATSMIGYAGEQVFSDTIRSSIGDAVDEFINAYLAVNPK